MKVLRPQQPELIDAFTAQTALGGITAGPLEKDEHLTDALRLDVMPLALCSDTT